MLNAVLNGKKRGTGLVAVEMQAAEGAEDVLTACVFERLAYLPNDRIAAVFANVLGDQYPLGEVDEFEFWPSWYLGETRVEPDVLIQANERRIVIEAKRWDGIQQQSATQLCAEIRAGLESDELEAGDVLLALGGLPEDDNTTIIQARELLQAQAGKTDIHIGYCSWRQFYQAIADAITPTDGQPLPRHEQTLLDDIAKAFNWHGLRSSPMLWLHDLTWPSDNRIRYTTMPQGFGLD